MIWTTLVLIVALMFVLWQRWRAGRGNLGKVIDYSQGQKGVRREEWLNYSESEARLEQRLGREAAERMIITVLLDNPDKSRKWCADKALYDLERDQRL